LSVFETVASDRLGGGRGGARCCARRNRVRI